MSTQLSFPPDLTDEQASELVQFDSQSKKSELEDLLRYCQEAAAGIKSLSETLSTEAGRTSLAYFNRAIANTHGITNFPTPASAFKAENALRVLYAECWGKALKLTDVMSFMPQAKREEWDYLIYDCKTPDFTPDIVTETLKSLMAQRWSFFGEMVDGIFQGLSRTHVTNRPEGFSKRMILAEVLTPGDVLSDTGELVHDFRYVVSKLTGRDTPCRSATSRILNMALTRPGDWLSVDGGAFKVKVFKKRTAHLEVHPDIAWKMNQILAINNPMAIPSRFRTPPKKAFKDIPVSDNLISNAALSTLKDGRFHIGEHEVFKDHHFYIRTHSRLVSKQVVEEVKGVLTLLGGLPVGKNVYAFDYDVRDSLAWIEVTGMIPDVKSYQYYPTQEALAQHAVDLADIDVGHRCLEPSAGTAGIARFMPKDQTECVEMSKLFSESLASQGYVTHHADFLKWGADRLFDRIIMNPPFSEGRALAHLSHAADLLATDGRLVAILPASLKGKKLIPSMSHTWHGPFEGQFSGTNVSVAILVLEN